MLAPPELKKIHPLGKAPVVSIEAPGVAEPIILAESALIVEYLTEHFGRWMIPTRYPEGKDGVIGAETQEWLKYRVSFRHLTSTITIAPRMCIGMHLCKADEGEYAR